VTATTPSPPASALFDLAAPRNYRLIHSDALVLRARIALARGDATTARNDAEGARQLAEFCEYAWAERDACEVLAQAWRALDALLKATATPTAPKS
jgi:hypothetical protein